TMSLEDDIKFKDNHVEMANNMLPTGLSYTIAPSGINFEKMVELTFFYEDNDMAILSENDLAVAYLDNNNWVVLGGELYRDEKSITVLVNRTGSYSLIINKFTESENELEVPSEFYLQQNYPNPFNPKTTIRFGLPKSVHTIIRIINLKGQIISTLIDETLHAGEHVIEWNGTDDKNVPVASGVYLYQLQADDFIHTRKLVLVK
ncbi:MAG: T9SS type A sorting domain-containing protein, partial [bacterium]